MPRIDVGDVQVFISDDKLDLSYDDNAPTESVYIEEVVLSKLSACGVDVSSWVDEDTTPKLVKWIIAAKVAAMIYNKAYSETDVGAGNPYANKLEERAHMILEGICTGNIDMLDVADDPSSLDVGQPSFYPTDQTGALDEEEGVRFTIGARF